MLKTLGTAFTRGDFDRTSALSRAIGTLLLLCGLFAGAPVKADPAAIPDDCAKGETFKTARSADSPAIVFAGNLVPGGRSVDFGLATPMDPAAHYFAVFFSEGTTPDNDTNGHSTRARKAAETDDLVAKKLLSAGQTILTVDVPAAAAGFWTKQNFYVYQCSGSPDHVSYLPVYVSPVASSIALTGLIGLAFYYAAACALRRSSGLPLIGTQAWNPSASRPVRTTVEAFRPSRSFSLQCSYSSCWPSC